MPEEQSLKVALPDSLRRQFANLEKRLFSLESWMALSAAAIVLLAAFFLFFVSDRFWNTPVWLRLLFALAGLAGVLGAGVWWMSRWVFRRRDLRALAAIVQRRYRRLGDRLLGIVELADEAKRPAHFSSELYRAAIDQVSAEATKYDFAEAANGRRARLEGFITGGLILLVLLPAVLLPQAAWNSLRRWIAPTASIPHFTLVELAEVPAEKIVPHGENFTVEAKVRYRSFWRPQKVKGLLGSRPPITAKVSEGELALPIPGQMQDGRLEIRVGDARAQVALSPKHRPALEQITAAVQLPGYLGYPEQKENIQGASLNLVEGSHFRVFAQATRELRGANVVYNQDQPGSLDPSSNSFSTILLPADKVRSMTFTWEDQLGLTNSAPWKLAVNVRKDAPPAPEFVELFRDVAILESEVLPLKTRARDDFGVKQLGLDWRLDMAETVTNDTPRRKFEFTAASQAEQQVEQTFNFSPAVLQVPPDTTVEVRAYALDFLPGREPSVTPVYRIHVLGNAQHAEMIRQNLESLLVHLEEVTRLQERIAAETREMKELQKLDTPEAAGKISELEKAQEQNSAQLSELAEEGMKTLREALRNPAFTENVLSEWTKDLHEMQQLSQQEMKESSESLQAAAKSEPGREQNLAESLQKQEEILQKLQEMQREVNEGLDELQALTLAQRLRKVSGAEEKLADYLKKNIADTVGLTPPELPDRYQKANTHFAGMQNETQAESHQLQGEISRFFERTQKPNYGQVSEQMQSSRPAEELDRVRGLIEENIGMVAMQNLALWASRFNDWADLLEPPPAPSGEGAGSGQGAGQQQDDRALKQLLALLRMREGQLNIQERTRLLHEYLEERSTYRDGAVLLAASQARLNRDLTQQAVENQFSMLEETYNDTIHTMTDVENLLDKPRTDEVTRGTQEKSVNMLTDLINLLNEEAKKNQSSSSSAGQGQGQQGDEMAFLMQMMAPQLAPGMQAGQQAGGNMSGGTTDKTGGELGGDASGASGEERSVRKASGVPQNYPTEFRPALEKYFRALEQNP